MTNDRSTAAKKRQSYLLIPAFALAATLVGGAARADINDDDAGWKARFDLGMDVGDAGRSTESIRAFLSRLAPETQQAILKGCEHYMLFPNGVQSSDTLPFCRVAVGVPTGGASSQPNIVNFGAVTRLAPPLRPASEPRPVYRLPYPINDED